MVNPIHDLIATIGLDRSELARMLGYASENSLRQAEAGRQSLPADKLAWLVAYAKLRAPFLAKLAKAEAEWLKKNPPPNEKKS